MLNTLPVLELSNILASSLDIQYIDFLYANYEISTLTSLHIMHKLCLTKKYSELRHIIQVHNIEPTIENVKYGLSTNDAELIKALYCNIDKSNYRNFWFSKFDSIFYDAQDECSLEIIDFLQTIYNAN